MIEITKVRLDEVPWKMGGKIQYPFGGAVVRYWDDLDEVVQEIREHGIKVLFRRPILRRRCQLLNNRRWFCVSLSAEV